MLQYYGENNKQNYIKRFKNLTLSSSYYNGCGPGRTCISSSLSNCMFVENRQIANDVIWYLRCLDKINPENLMTIIYPIQVYNCASITSCTNNIKKYKNDKYLL